MQRKNLFIALILATMLALGSNLRFTPVAQAQLQYNQWMPTAYLYEGGVPQKIQLVRTQFSYPSQAEPEPTTVFSVNMESGIFRSEYSGGSWGSWQGSEVPGGQTYGLDAVKISGTTHVMISWTGVYVGDYAPEISSWDRPHTMPQYWDYGLVHDCAFYCEMDGDYPIGFDPPQSQYYVALIDTIWNLSQTIIAKPGIYQWVNSTQEYDRVDTTVSIQQQLSHGYSNFWRDARNPNVIYTIRNTKRNDQQIIIDNGFLCRIDGPYNDPNFTIYTIVPQGGTLYDVISLDQWYAGGINDYIFSYLLVKWHDGSQTKNSIFVSTNLADAEEPTFTRLADLADPAEYTALLEKLIPNMRPLPKLPWR